MKYRYDLHVWDYSSIHSACGPRQLEESQPSNVAAERLGLLAQAQHNVYVSIRYFVTELVPGQQLGEQQQWFQIHFKCMLRDGSPPCIYQQPATKSPQDDKNCQLFRMRFGSSLEKGCTVFSHMPWIFLSSKARIFNQYQYKAVQSNPTSCGQSE